MTRRPRLLAVGQGVLPGGYTRVMAGLLGELGRAFEVTLFAIDGWDGSPPPPRTFPVRVNRLHGDRFGRRQLPALLAELEPEVVLLYHDAELHSVHHPALEAHRRRRPRTRVVVYCSGTARVPASLADADLVVTFTGTGRAALLERLHARGLRAPPTAVVPHGIDVESFAPLDRAAARARLFPGRPELDSAFLVLNANRNLRRKRVDLTLAGFTRLARERTDAFLYLHMGPRDAGFDVPGLARELGISDRLLLTPHDGRRPRVDDERLNLVYNACDVGLSTAAAEGFGLVPFEHAATGAAQVVPDHGAYAELWRGSALLVPAAEANGNGRVVRSDAVAAALGRLASDRGLREGLATRAQDLARSPSLGWPALGERWRQLLAAA